MLSSKIVLFASLLAMASCHGQILAAVGDSGKSVGFQVDNAIARNCTNISPCQQDATIIRQAEIDANIVNECGRTELTGNIDVGQNTEDALAAGAVTKVKAGTAMTVTIHQVNADGAGPYVCDLDETGNAGIISQNLSVTNNVPGSNGFSQAQSANFDMTVTMPTQLACKGGSTGNICTVRCRNNALAGPFGGCFAVMQTDITPSVNTASTISTAQTLNDIMKQVAQNQADLPAAIQANALAGSSAGAQGAAAVEAALGIEITSSASPVQTPNVELGGNAAVASATSVTSTRKAAKTSKATGAKPTASAATAKGGNGNGNAKAGGNENADAGGKGNKDNENKKRSSRAMRRGLRNEHN